MKKISFLSFVFLILTLSGCTSTDNIKSNKLLQQKNVNTNIEENYQKLNTQENFTGEVCGVAGLGEKYNGDVCNRSCSQKNDCQFTCGCGAINIKENCFDEGIIYDCVNIDIDCINNKCISI